MVEIVLSARWLTNWRAAKIFHPHVVSALSEFWSDSPESQSRAEQLASILEEHSEDPQAGMRAE